MNQKMMRNPIPAWLGFMLFVGLVLGCNPGYDVGPSAIEAGETPHPRSPIFQMTMNDIDGHPVNLKQFQGKVLMIINTASFCGNTPQYDGLQTLYEQYQEQGFEILAFPANNFGKQEPGTNEEIATFCYTKYALTFPLFEKISVQGDDTHPLYQYLTQHSPYPGEIEWNFQKFLVNRKGQVIARYRPGLKPLSPQIIQAVQKALSDSPSDEEGGRT